MWHPGTHTEFQEGEHVYIPRVLAWLSDQTTHLLPSSIPSVDSAIALNEIAGGHLSPDRCYGVGELQRLRDRDFEILYPSMDAVYGDILHADGIPFRQATHYFTDMSCRFPSLVKIFMPFLSAIIIVFVLIIDCLILE